MTMLRKYFLHQLKKIIKEGKTVLREIMRNKCAYRVLRNGVSEPLGGVC